jgi:enoyl-CoA hydratase/carnithine racemase
MRVSKEGIRRVASDSAPQGEDLIREAYGSRDFGIGVQAFLEKKRPAWTGT